MSGRLARVNLVIALGVLVLGVVNAIIGTHATLGWFAAACGGAMGAANQMTILNVQRIARLERERAEFWKSQAGRAGRALVDGWMQPRGGGS